MDVAMIKSVYSGQAGRCCCGCAGKHSESERSKKIVLNKILRAEYKDDGDHIWAQVGNRLYVAYKEAA